MEGEERLKEMASDLVLGHPERMRRLVQEQMQSMIKRGVKPTWKNFTELGNSWDRIKNMLTEEAQFQYHRIWNETLREIENESK